MPQLKYIGPDPAVLGMVPLPEGWGAFDHEDQDEERAAEKVASGNYEVVKPQRKAAESRED